MKAGAIASPLPRRPGGDSPWLLTLRRLGRNKAAMAGLTYIVVVAALAVLAPWVAPYSYEAADYDAKLSPPSREHLMGTDFLGRDMFSRIIYGARVSLGVAVAATLISLLLGSAYGAVSGYVAGRLDNAMMRVVDVIYSFPDLLLIILINATLSRESLSRFLDLLYQLTAFVVLSLAQTWTSPAPALAPLFMETYPLAWLRGGELLDGDNLALLLALSLVTWVYVARLIRGEVLRLREETYVEAARALGVGHLGIITRHILPNTWGPLIVTLTFRIPAMILAESTLSFIGLGIQPPKSSWGTLAADGWTSMQFYWHLIFFPSLAIFLTMLAFNFLGDGLRDALAPERRP
jgi:oligopeptide transport system permease protein